MRRAVLAMTMGHVTGQATGSAADMRRAFDAAFAEPPRAAAAKTVDLLAIAVGPARYAVRLAEIAGLYADWRLTPVPGPVADLLGLTEAAGTVVPVYDLHALLGHPPARPSRTPPRWVVVTGTDPAVGLAFDQLDGHLRVSADAIAPGTGTGADAARAPQLIRADEVLRTVVDLPAVMSGLAARMPTVGDLE